MNMSQFFYNLGRSDARNLRENAHNMTGTEIIDQDFSIPLFSPVVDYTNYPVGSPVQDDGQVWLLIQPHNAANYQGRPATLRALWGLAHTTNPQKAKPWVTPLGTSGMYMKNEVYIDEEGTIWRAKVDNLVHDAKGHQEAWEKVTF